MHIACHRRLNSGLKVGCTRRAIGEPVPCCVQFLTPTPSSSRPNPRLRLSGASTRSTVVLILLNSSLQIDVLVLYSTDTFAAGEETQWVTNIVTGFATANEATTNSGIDLQFNLVRVDQVSEC